MNKRGDDSGVWGVRKVIVLILSLILLVLVIFFTISGGINPLFEKVIGVYDFLLITFKTFFGYGLVAIDDDCVGPIELNSNFKSPFSEGGVSSREVSNLNNLLSQGFNKLYFTVCHSGECRLESDKFVYTYKGGEFKRNGGELVKNPSVDVYGSFDCSEKLKSWEVQNGLFKEFYKLLTGKELSNVSSFNYDDYNKELAEYLGFYSMKFIIETKAQGLTSESSFRYSWLNGVWYKEIDSLSDGDWKISGTVNSDSVVLKEIYNEVNDGFFGRDDLVYYSVEKPVYSNDGRISYSTEVSKRHIGNLVGGDEYLKGEEELGALMKQFGIWRDKSGTYYSEDNFKKLYEKVHNKKISVLGKEVMVSLVEYKSGVDGWDNFLVQFSLSDGKVYGIRAMFNEEFKDNRRVNSPVWFFEFINGKWTWADNSFWIYDIEEVKQYCVDFVVYNFIRDNCIKRASLK